MVLIRKFTVQKTNQHRANKKMRRPTLITKPWIALAALVFLFLFTSHSLALVDKEIDEIGLKKIMAPLKGDLDLLIKHRVIRALVAYSKTNYFLDGVRERGVTYEALKQFEKFLNQKLKKRHLKIHVVMIPVARDQLLPYLVEGRGDIAAAMLTETRQRLQTVDFADPFSAAVKELVVTSPSAPPIKSLDDLSGKTVFVRKSSSYYRSLQKLNQNLQKKGKPPVKIEPADEYLETEDILEMVNADLIPITVADDYLTDFWKQIFTNIKVHKKVFVRSGGKIAWAIRKNSPKLKKAINQFVKKAKKGTLLGNIIIKKYLQNTKWVRNSLAPEGVERFKNTIAYFKKYARQYGFDWLMVTALAYQESRLNQKLRSSAGAVGVMQILPNTAAAPPVKIPDIHKLEENIHAGVKYLRHIYDRYFKDSDMDDLNKVLFTFASYNAGPNRVASLRKKAARMGLNPNIWFHNVEVAAAKVIGRETVQYVSNIFKYYIAYTQIAEKMERKKSLTKTTETKK